MSKFIVPKIGDIVQSGESNVILKVTSILANDSFQAIVLKKGNKGSENSDWNLQYTGWKKVKYWDTPLWRKLEGLE